MEYSDWEDPLDYHMRELGLSECDVCELEGECCEDCVHRYRQSDGMDVDVDMDAVEHEEWLMDEFKLIGGYLNKDGTLNENGSNMLAILYLARECDGYCPSGYVFSKNVMRAIQKSPLSPLKLSNLDEWGVDDYAGENTVIQNHRCESVFVENGIGVREDKYILWKLGFFPLRKLYTGKTIGTIIWFPYDVPLSEDYFVKVWDGFAPLISLLNWIKYKNYRLIDRTLKAGRSIKKAVELVRGVILKFRIKVDKDFRY